MSLPPRFIFLHAGREQHLEMRTKGKWERMAERTGKWLPNSVLESWTCKHLDSACCRKSFRLITVNQESTAERIFSDLLYDSDSSPLEADAVIWGQHSLIKCLTWVGPQLSAKICYKFKFWQGHFSPVDLRVIPVKWKNGLNFQHLPSLIFCFARNDIVHSATKEGWSKCRDKADCSL